jgi:branched-chain amino acid transport system substrate-binding protein
LELHIDADFSVNAAAAQAISLGVRAALHTVGDQIAGRPVIVVERDHSGNVRRAHAAMRDVVSSPRALALIGGLHSPPYMSHGEEINAAGLPTLLPWSAAAPLTRQAVDGSNFIFRLSVDDSKASRFLVRSSVQEFGCRNVALLLLDTGWGRSNHEPMREEIVANGATIADEIFFRIGTGSAAAKAIARDLIASGADCAIMLSNSKEGAYLVNALKKVGANLSVFSHWGIAGGDFAQNTSHAARAHLNLRVLQTCNMPEHAEAAKKASTALAAARAVLPDEGILELTDIPATVGFVHAYDLTLTLIAAGEQASQTSGWQQGIGQMRVALKQALEDLDTPVSGIMNRYDPPFRSYSLLDRDAHEALDERFFCFRTFDADGRLAWAVRLSGS